MSNKQNIRLKICYDGTHYLGWQKTDIGPTIEASLQSCLEQLLQEPISLQAASRTDAGVHAQGQIVNFYLSKSRDLDLDQLLYRLNCILPRDITLLEISDVPYSFHPTLDCCSKEYHYRICCNPYQMPHERFYAWHCPYRLDLEKMQEASLLLIGKKDFCAFCNVKKKETYDHYIREVTTLKILELPQRHLEIVIAGNHFLYKMVRNMVGTLVAIGRGKLSSSELPRILESRDRKLAGVTAPAHGLYLQRVLYSTGD